MAHLVGHVHNLRQGREVGQTRGIATGGLPLGSLAKEVGQDGRRGFGPQGVAVLCVARVAIGRMDRRCVSGRGRVAARFRRLRRTGLAIRRGPCCGLCCGPWGIVRQGESGFFKQFAHGEGKGRPLHRLQQGVGVPGFRQGVPAAVVRSDGQGLEKGQASLKSLIFEALQRIGFGRAVHGGVHHQEKSRDFPVQFQSLAHGAGLCALQAEGLCHVGQILPFHGPVGHNGHVGLTGIRRCGLVLQRLEPQGKGNGRALWPAFNIEVTVVGSGQLPGPRHGERGAVARGQARAGVRYRKQQVAGVRAFGHTPRRKVHGPARSGAHGAFQQHAEGFAQGLRLPFIHVAELGRHVPGEANAGIFGRGADGVVGLTHQMLEVERTAGFANKALVHAFARIVHHMGQVGCGLEHVFGILAHCRGQGAVAQSRAFAHEAIKGGAQGVFPQAGIGVAKAGAPACAGSAGLLARCRCAVPGRSRFGRRAQGRVFGRPVPGIAASRKRGRQQAQIGVIQRLIEVYGPVFHHKGRAITGKIGGKIGHGWAAGPAKTIQAGQRTAFFAALPASAFGSPALGHVARRARARNDQGAQGRAPQGGRGHEVGGVSAVQPQNSGGHEERRQQAAQQKAPRPAKAHDGAANGAGHKDQGAHGPQGQIAYDPAKAGHEGQQRQGRARQGEQHELRVQKA